MNNCILCKSLYEEYPDPFITIIINNIKVTHSICFDCIKEKFYDKNCNNCNRILDEPYEVIILFDEKILCKCCHNMGLCDLHMNKKCYKCNKFY